LCWLALALVTCKQQKPALSPEATQGRELYLKMCAVCHGESGEGYKADQAPRLAQPDFLASVSDGFLKNAINNGRTGSTMSAWSKLHGGPLDPPDVEALVAFIRSWEQSARVLLDERPAAGVAARGQTAYEKECARCHGAKGTGGPNIQVGGRELLQSASVGYLRYAIRVGRPGTDMPAFADKLGDPAIDDVLSLLQSWKAPPPAPSRDIIRPPPIPLGPVPLNPNGPAAQGFKTYPATTPLEQVKKELDRGARMAILDARAPSDYIREHIAGAVSVPFYDPSPYYEKLPKNAWLVAYCSCPHAESSTLARLLTEHGFKDVTVLDEGLGVWRSKKYPTNSSDKP
jgi:mono/diheme cytochrome c family protein/rhodanese-related sulfurtransferase